MLTVTRRQLKHPRFTYLEVPGVRISARASTDMVSGDISTPQLRSFFVHVGFVLIAALALMLRIARHTRDLAAFRARPEISGFIR